MKRETGRTRRRLARLPLASAIWLAMAPMAWAQAPAAQDEAPVLDAIEVTAQKRTENLQEVPISIEVLGTEQIDQLNIDDLEDITTAFPTVSYQRVGEVPSNAQIYMRGVASGGDGNHSGSLPTVGVYLDEQPITTIRGPIDIHPYDLARIEALAGPQGTLYGASSLAGTLRIITNKPDTSGFEFGYGAEFNSIDDGGTGHVLEGFANLPISDTMAIRMVAWEKHDAGYIDNEFGTRTFPTAEITIDNAEVAEQDFNYADTAGARIALGIELGDDWTVTPSVISQHQTINGSNGVDRNVGELSTHQWKPQTVQDDWTQSALTVQGRIGNLDVTYAYAHFTRDLENESDYNDYSYWYDTLYGYYMVDDAGVTIDPSQYIQAVNGFRKKSHELRIASPADQRFRFVAGVFWQEQTNDIQERYFVDDMTSDYEVPGWPDTLWLTKQDRVDRDRAIFGEVSFDITEALTATAGMRFFDVDNSLRGFFGFGAGYVDDDTYGEYACLTNPSLPPYEDTPCEVFDKNVEESDHIGRFNLSWDVNDDLMVYGTWSEGYRPGGINRRGTLPPYLSDYLTNWELGWKAGFADGRVVFNGAVFQQDWEDFQFSILGQNGLTEIKNANNGRIRGLEMDLSWAATYNLTVDAGVAFYDAELTENYCGQSEPDGTPVTECSAPDWPYDRAFAGTQLPITAPVKGNVTARYEFDHAGYDIYFQGRVVHEGERETDLREGIREILGTLDAYTMLDLSAGVGRNSWNVDFYVKNATDERAELSRFTQCVEATCALQPYDVVAQPRTMGLRFSQEF